MDDDNPARDTLAAFQRHQASVDQVVSRLLTGIVAVAFLILLYVFRLF
jgi:hypothetical protein